MGGEEVKMDGRWTIGAFRKRALKVWWRGYEDV